MIRFGVVIVLILSAVAIAPVAGHHPPPEAPDWIGNDCQFSHIMQDTEIFTCADITEGRSGEAAGVYYNRPDIIVLDVEGKEDVPKTYIHELGHSIGKDHEGTGIMLPGTGWYNHRCDMGEDLSDIVNTYDLEVSDDCSISTPFGKMTTD